MKKLFICGFVLLICSSFTNKYSNKLSYIYYIEIQSNPKLDLKQKNFLCEFLYKNCGHIIDRFGTIDNWLLTIQHMSFPKKTHSNKPESFEVSSQYTYSCSVSPFDDGDYVPFEFFSYTPYYTQFLLFDMMAEGLEFDPPCEEAGVSPYCICLLTSGLVDNSNQSYLNDCEIEYGWVLPCLLWVVSPSVSIKTHAFEYYDNEFDCD